MRTPIEKYVEIDKLIDDADETAQAVIVETLRQRWEFGRLMLSERVTKKGDPAKRLPDGRKVELANATGKSQTELQYRMKFAESYPTEEELHNALCSFDSWYAITQFLYHKEKLEEQSEAVIADDEEDEEQDEDEDDSEQPMYQDQNVVTGLNRMLLSMFRVNQLAQYSPDAKTKMINALRRTIKKLEASL
jgi:hypothetical protein